MNTQFVVTRSAHCPLTNKVVRDGFTGIRLEDIDHGNYKVFANEVFENNYQLVVELTKNNSNKIFDRKVELTATNEAVYQIKMIIPFNEHKLLQLAVYNWKVEKVTTSTVTLTSFKAVNLNALSKHIDGVKVSKIEVLRSENNTLTHKFSALNKDVIKECQKLDKKKALTNREDKPQKHVLSK